MSDPNLDEPQSGWLGKLLKSTSNRLILGIVVVLLMTRACNPNVDWEEEVRLNTGETIVVKRSGSYSYGYSAGSGFIGFSPNPKATIKFEYKGKSYSFTSEAGIMGLAIAPDGNPNFVAHPDANSWQWKNNYYCTSPSYVQFKPDEQGTKWTWPPAIENWWYGLPANLMPDIVDISDDGKKFTVAEIKERLTSVFRGSSQFQSIDPKHSVTNNCPRRN